MLSLFSLASVLWTAVIAYTLYLAVVWENPNVDKYFTRLLAGTIGISFLMACLPFPFEKYGESSG